MKPTLIVHTTYFPVRGLSDRNTDPERAAAVRLGEDLYELLTRPLADALGWGAGIPVRVATSWDRIDCSEATHVVVIPVLGHAAFRDEDVRRWAICAISRWNQPGWASRVLPVPVNASWRSIENRIPKPLLTELYDKNDPRRA